MADISEVNVNGSLYNVKHKLTDDFESHWEEVLATDDPSVYPSVESLLLNLIYPVGSIYWSKNATNPSNLFGGTWVQIEDTFILAAGSEYKINTSGGESEHTLALTEMPSHDHGVGSFAVNGTVEIRHSAGGTTVYNQTSGALTAEANNGTQVWSNASQLVAQSGTLDIIRLNAKDGNGFTGRSEIRGMGTAHNNMPPYITAYCWERTQ